MKRWYDKWNEAAELIPNLCTGCFQTLKDLKGHCKKNIDGKRHILFTTFLRYREMSDSEDEDENLSAAESVQEKDKEDDNNSERSQRLDASEDGEEKGHDNHNHGNRGDNKNFEESDGDKKSASAEDDNRENKGDEDNNDENRDDDESVEESDEIEDGNEIEDEDEESESVKDEDMNTADSGLVEDEEDHNKKGEQIQQSEDSLEEEADDDDIVNVHEEVKGQEVPLRRSKRGKGIPQDRTNLTADQVVLFLTKIGAIEEKSYKIKTLYYYNNRIKGKGKCRFRAMFNAWPGAEQVAWTLGLTNEDSEEIKRLVLDYDPDTPCHVFNIEKGRYRHWVALTQQFYHNDGYYYEVTNFSNALLALSLIEEGLQEPNYMDIERQVLEAQDETTIATLGEDKKGKK